MSKLNGSNPGYKQSEFGWIPQDWKVELLDKVAKRGSGHTPDKSFVNYYNGGVKWISLADSYRLDKGYVYETEVEISDDGLKNSSAVLHPSGTVLMSRDAGVGKSAIMGIDMAVSQHFITWTCNGKLDNVFLYYWLQFKKIYFEKQAVGSTIKTIGLPFFKKLKIVYPSLPEQRVIAQILSTWDISISKAYQLIQFQQQRKKVLMQQLLTGKKRLPGFSGEWKERRLGELFDERNDCGRVELPLLSITADRGVIYQSESDKKNTSNDDKSKYKRICVGDIGYNTMRMWQGRSALSALEGLVSPAYTIVVPKEIADALYFSYLFKTEHVIHSFFRNSQGLVDDTLNCKFKDFALVKVSVPPTKEEQMAIAAVLKTADDEIETLRKKLNALKEQKKGLMQQLLTGKKRVKV